VCACSDLELQPQADFEGSAWVFVCPAADNRRGVIRVISAQDRVADAEELPDLLGDSREHVLGLNRAGNQGCDPAQRRLLVREAAQLKARLRIGDSGGKQLGEAGEPNLRVGRQRIVAHGSDDQNTPQSALDADRHADPPADACSAGDVGDLP
jgi:hypothetical protein